MQRKENENFINYCERCTQALALGTISYQEWATDVLGEIPYSDETLRRCSLFFSRFLDKLNQEKVNSIEDTDVLAEIKVAKDELERERMKIHQQNLELKESYRWQARNELYQERIVDAINKLEPICIRVPHNLGIPKVDSTMLICLSDFHAGSTFEIKGLYNEIVNKYSFDIMKARMWRLLDKLEQDDIAYDNITIAILGDCFENILRPGSLTKLREPVIDTVIKFSEFISQWIAEVQRDFNVPINVVTVGGNHDISRPLGSKPQFEEENLVKLVVEFMKLRLKDCSDIYVDDYTEVAVKNIRGTNVMFAHGVTKDLSQDLEYFSNLYNVDIDEVWAGHLHSLSKDNATGITEIGDRRVERVGSICGIDPYAKKCRKAARPSSTVCIYTNEGRTWRREYYL